MPLESQVTHPSQNVISEASKEELSIQTQQQESHAPVPVVHNQRHHWRIRAAITALLMSIGVIYTINWPPLIKTEKSLEQIATLKVKERSQECSNQAANTSLDGNTQAMLRNCQLANAKQLAAAQNFPAAIAEAGKISIMMCLTQKLSI